MGARMKLIRLLLALCVVLPDVAAARILVYTNNTSDISGEVHSNVFRNVRLVANMLERGRADYFAKPSFRGLRTLDTRTGSLLHNYNTVGQYAEQFDAVVAVNSPLGAQLFGTGGNNPDSMLRRATAAKDLDASKAPTVPQLFLFTNVYSLVNGDNNLAMVDADAAAQCTTGSVGVGSVFESDAGYLASDPTVRWMVPAYAPYFVMNPSRPAGGLRVHIGSAVPNMWARNPANPGARIAEDRTCQWCDSMATSTFPDSTILWERMMTHITGAKPVVFASMGGGGLSSDSVSNVIGPPRPNAEGDYFVIMAGLARIDSLTNGGVWPAANGVPYKVALTIDGAYSYNARRATPGILKADSATFSASMDSLATLGIPVTFGVNLDSVAANAEWKRWLAKVPKARFSPQNWTGVRDSAGISGAASFTHPVDIMGRNRKRIAFGDSSAAGKDTSLWALLRGGRFKCDSIWPGKASRFLMAPLDDWSPRGMNSSNVGPGIDSLVFAIARAGFDGVRANSGDPDHDANYLFANPRGWVNQQRWLTGTRNAKLKLLTYPGHGISGGEWQLSRSDSVAPFDSSTTTSHSMIIQEICRAWLGATQYADRNHDQFPHDPVGPYSFETSRVYNGVYYNEKDMVWPTHYKGNIIRMGCDDFSGRPDLPARRGWWVIKSLANQFKAINRIAGRTIIEFAYPEEVEP